MKALEVYDRCLSGKPFTKNLKIYTKEYLLKVLEELEYIEEYEKCNVLNKFIQKRFNHESNYGCYMLDGEKSI